MTYVEGLDTPRSVWDQDRTLIENISGTANIPGSPEVGVVFVAPTSGRVLVFIGGQIRNRGGTQRVFLRPEVYADTDAAQDLLTLVEDGAFKEFASSPPETAFMAGSRMFILTGLTPGKEHYARVTYYVSGGSDSDIGAREIGVVPLP